jgi:hypothetical protein
MAAICESCGQEMLPSTNCSMKHILLIDGSYERHRYKGGWGHTCGDCGVAKGGFHHPGCDVERCPRCREQLIMCGCWEDLELAYHGL